MARFWDAVAITLCFVYLASAVVIAVVAMRESHRPQPSAPVVPPHTDPPMPPVDQAETATAWPHLVSSYYQESHHEHDA